MATLIFDIETVGEEWASLDEVTQKQLTRWIDKAGRSKEERDALLKDVQSGLGFSPFTGRIVAIGLFDVERAIGVVYYSGENMGSEEAVGSFTYKERTEALMLREFWDGARHYDTFVTFNGRSFDAAFLMHRSAISGVRPSMNLLEGRYPYQQKSCRHIDLQDEFTFYGAIQRRPSLHLCARAYGVASPKLECGGDDVAELFASKKFRDIADYNARDVEATTELYKIWQAYFKPQVITEDHDITY